MLYKVFPEGMISGPVPQSVLPSPPQSGRGYRKPLTSAPQACTPRGGGGGATATLIHHNKFTIKGILCLLIAKTC